MESFNDLSPRIQSHLKGIAETSGLPAESALTLLTQNWLEKRKLFLSQIKALAMDSLGSFSVNDPRPVLILTYSGSLLALGALDKEGRSLEYASINLRQDVPSLVLQSQVGIQEDLQVDHPGQFVRSTLTRCSDILYMAACAPEVPRGEQEKRLREAVIFLTNGFVKINKTLNPTPRNLEHFTQRTLTQYLSRKNDLSQGVVKQLLEDYVSLLEAGMLLGERVPLGRLGKLTLVQKKATKARVGRNPLTGEEVTIPAKPPTAVPRFRFSKIVKEKAQMGAEEVSPE